jgi:hypothetical protein
MPLVHPDDLNDSTVRSEDHGASNSLIIDQREPGQALRTEQPRTDPGSFRANGVRNHKVMRLCA